ncbi:MAG: TonB-dependent receptor plug domain-containing protein [Polyangiaceae bacterium]
MKIKYLLLAAACTFPMQAFAEEAADSAVAKDGAQSTVEAQPTKRAFTTGVARGRDLLDSAISTSALDESEIQKFAPRSVGEIFRNIPGMRAEAYSGEGYANISIRGLPLALGGAKFLQLQEDGLPVLEFGDIAFATADQFLRADLTLSQVQAIRGGSASTFSSNSPGGVINLISKTGEEEGGSVQLTTGLDYETYRMDFDYGAKITDTLRFNIGGFYRQGEGPRATGYDAYKGGQVKFNLTKTFEGGLYPHLCQVPRRQVARSTVSSPMRVTRHERRSQVRERRELRCAQGHHAIALSPVEHVDDQEQSVHPLRYIRRHALQVQDAGPGSAVRDRRMDRHRAVPLCQQQRAPSAEPTWRLR